MCSTLGRHELLRLSGGGLLRGGPATAGPVRVDGAARRALDVHGDVGRVVGDRSDAPVGDQLVGPGHGAGDQQHGTSLLRGPRTHEWQERHSPRHFCHAEDMTGSDRPLVVSLLAGDGVLGAFGLGVAAEVFGYDHRRFGMPRFDFAVVTDRPGVVRTDTGLALYVEHGLERLAVSDIVLVTAWEKLSAPVSPVVLDALRAVHARGAQIVSHCTGDRKSTRLNSSHANISYAVFCLKK